MNYISEIFQRLHTQTLTQLLLHGTEGSDIDDRPYKIRIDSAKKEMIDMLYQKFPEMKEREKITDYIYQYASVLEEVYMEIGLQAGAILSFQVYKNLLDNIKDRYKT